jgi:hypothetical protein
MPVVHFRDLLESSAGKQNEQAAPNFVGCRNYCGQDRVQWLYKSPTRAKARGSEAVP